MDGFSDEFKAIRAERDRLVDLASCMYQAAGAFNFPELWLDVCNAAQNGEDFSTDGLLPIMPTMKQLADLHLEIDESEARANRG